MTPFKTNMLILLLTLSILSINPSLAQSPKERGFPLITNHNFKDYGGGSSNWAILQGDRGKMYFGNNSGLLEYDGAAWRRFPMPNQSIVRSLALGDSGKIYTGGVGELGYFQPDEAGKLMFHSMKDLLPPDTRDFAAVWQSVKLNGKVYFLVDRYLFVWDIQKKAFSVIPSQNSFHIMFAVNGKIYIREWGKGLCLVQGDSVSLVKGGEQFAGERIYAMLPFPGEKGTALVVTRTMGLFKYDGQQFTPFKTEADQFIQENQIYLNNTVLQDGNFLLGTIGGGAVVMEPSGKIQQYFNMSNGVIDNAILFSYQDRAGNIWMATSNGISSINYTSPATYFDARNQLNTSAQSLIRHKGKLYLAANPGLYYLDPQRSTFTPVKNSSISQYFTFAKAGNTLLAGGGDGLFKIEGDALLSIRKTIATEYTVRTLRPSRLHPGRVYVGAFGLWAVQQQSNTWIDEGNIIPSDDAITGIEEMADGSLWVSTYISGVYRVRFAPDPQGGMSLSKPAIEQYGAESGLPEGSTYITVINGTPYFNTPDSLYTFDERTKRFYSDLKDPIMVAFYKLANHEKGIRIQLDSLNRLWLSTNSTLALGTPGPDGSYTWDAKTFQRFAPEGIQAIYAEPNGQTWFCGLSSLIQYDFGKKATANGYDALVSRVSIGGDSTIYHGAHASQALVPQIAFANNAIRFNFAATSYEEKGMLQFQTFLEGFDKDWSAWTREHLKEYTNLAPGSYTFRVKAVNSLGQESSMATYEFEILPPWYLSWPAYIFYGLLLFFVIYLADRVQRRRLIAKERHRAMQRELEQAKEIEKSYHELKVAQNQLIQSERMVSLGELAAGIAHEIQNPLNFVNNFSEVSADLIREMNEEIDKGNTLEVKEIAADLTQNLDIISQHGKRASSIVKGMLEHSRTSKGEKRSVDINALADEFLRLSFHGLRAKDKSFNADFKTDFDPNLPKVEVIPQDIGRVLLNLINNAFYAVSEKQKTPTGLDDYKPTVTVSTKKLGDRIEISVKDNGPGIPDEIKDKILQPFFTTKKGTEGTGLGLSITNDIVKAHGGELSVNSKINAYTEFRIQLPI